MGDLARCRRPAKTHTSGPSFDAAKVEDAMHPGVLTCPPETPLRTVARMMASTDVLTVSPGDPLSRVAELMTEQSQP